MKKKFIDMTIRMFDDEINYLALAISDARRSGDTQEMLKMCERQDEVLLLFHEMMDIINRNYAVRSDEN